MIKLEACSTKESVHAALLANACCVHVNTAFYNGEQEEEDLLAINTRSWQSNGFKFELD
jgi:hypothetical protein